MSAVAAVELDSRPDTWQHIHRVQELLLQVVGDLQRRALVHDQSKLVEPEVSRFDEATGLSSLTYGSDEYKAALARLGPALEHHYAANDHHPEHHRIGFGGMGLVELMEMLADWKAATERHADGDLLTSIEKNSERFGYGAEMTLLLITTARYLDWL